MLLKKVSNKVELKEIMSKYKRKIKIITNLSQQPVKNMKRWYLIVHQ